MLGNLLQAILLINNYHSQYAIYRSKIRTGNTGQLHCRLRGGKNAPVVVR